MLENGSFAAPLLDRSARQQEADREQRRESSHVDDDQRVPNFLGGREAVFSGMAANCCRPSGDNRWGRSSTSEGRTLHALCYASDRGDVMPPTEGDFNGATAAWGKNLGTHRMGSRPKGELFVCHATGKYRIRHYSSESRSQVTCPAMHYTPPAFDSASPLVSMASHTKLANSFSLSKPFPCPSSPAVFSSAEDRCLAPFTRSPFATHANAAETEASSSPGIPSPPSCFCLPAANFSPTKSFLRLRWAIIEHDFYSAVLSLSWFSLLLVTAILFFSAAWILALVLFFSTLYLTAFSPADCLGDGSTGLVDFYFFTVETMFSIGYGTPRYPACRWSSWYVTIVSIVGTLLHSLVVGAVFAKFATGSRRRYLVRFSDGLCGEVRRETNMQRRRSSGSQQVVEYNQVSGVHSGRAGNSVGNLSNNVASVTKVEASWSGDTSSITQDGAEEQNQSDRKAPYGRAFFVLQFRMMSLSQQAFFNTKLSVYLLRHGLADVSIFKFTQYTADKPLDFLQIPIVISVDSRHLNNPRCFDFADSWSCYELLALLHFTDNPTGRSVEIRRSWNLEEADWGFRFSHILRRNEYGGIDVNIKGINLTEQIHTDSLNNLEIAGGSDQKTNAMDSAGRMETLPEVERLMSALLGRNIADFVELEKRPTKK